MKKMVMAIMVLSFTIFTYGEMENMDHHKGHEMKEDSKMEMKSEAKAESAEQTICPVMGGEINKELYVDHEGKRVYVCCQMCIGKVNKEPEKYISQLEKEGVELEVVED